MKEKKDKLSAILIHLESIISKKVNSEKKSYTSELLTQDIDRISQKVGEEAIEVVIASNNNSKQQVIYESADLIFHLMVLWKKLKIKNDDIAEELIRTKNDKQ